MGGNISSSDIIEEHTSSCQGQYTRQHSTHPAVSILSREGDHDAIAEWNPAVNSLLACGGRNSARIWDFSLSEGGCGSMTSGLDTPPPPPLFTTYLGDMPGAITGIRSLEWSKDGSLLATGGAMGGHIWNREGQLITTLLAGSASQGNGSGGGGTVTDTVKFNPTGDCILTSTVKLRSQGKVNVCDVTTGRRLLKVATGHSPITSIEWHTKNSFATSSKDSHDIRVWEFDLEKTPEPGQLTRPLRLLRGHKRGVNDIKWGPMGNLLASGSLDKSVKLWSLSELLQSMPLSDLRGHKAPVTVLAWAPCPKDPNIKCADHRVMLASGAIDHEVKIWDVHRGVSVNSFMTGSCYGVNNTNKALRQEIQQCLIDTSDGVATNGGDMASSMKIAFSPGGNHVAILNRRSRVVQIWDTRSNNLSHCYKTSMNFQPILSWNRNSDKIAFCCQPPTATPGGWSRSVAMVLDLRSGAGLATPTTGSSPSSPSSLSSSSPAASFKVQRTASFS